MRGSGGTGWRRRGRAGYRLQVAGYRFSPWLFWAEEGLELGVRFNDVVCDGAQDINAKVMVFGVLEGGGDQFERDAFAALRLGDFGVPEGEPAVAIGFEFEIAGLAVLLDFETAAGDLGWVVHS